MLNIEA